ncbi:hypothetical protein D2E53_09945 [Mycobacteroides abscessus]|nr:hypothetical protein D2E37_15415 [Mycobacteroides abscessus]RIS82068.1 hypothetical protein D2E53_09945 [Mycobacteroides abscessus]
MTKWVVNVDHPERTATAPKLCLAQDPDADELLSESPLALLIGMCLDQQIPLEKAFRGPKVIADRLAAAGDLKCVDLDQQGRTGG